MSPKYVDGLKLQEAVLESMREDEHLDPKFRMQHHREHQHFLGMIDSQPAAPVMEKIPLTEDIQSSMDIMEYFVNNHPMNTPAYSSLVTAVDHILNRFKECLEVPKND